MKKKRFTEEQIIGILREQEAGAKVADLARKHAVSEATLYNWKGKFGGMNVYEAKGLRALEDENAKLKKLLADQMLEAAALRKLLGKNVWSAPSVQGSRSFGRSSLHKCIRPLASELLLQPGHDEMHARRSRIMVRTRSTVFCTELTACRSTVSSSLSRTSQSVEKCNQAAAGSRFS